MKVAIVGASGAVGQEFIRLMEERNFPAEEIILFGSERSAGQTFRVKGKNCKVKELQDNDDFKDIDIAFVSAGGTVSRLYADTITKHGTIMIDNSSAFRMEKDIPLVVPEVNPEDAKEIPRRIISNPNCSTIQMVVTLKAIDDICSLQKIRVATYQAASGAGQKGMEELETQVKSYNEGKDVTATYFSDRLLFNLIPQIDVFSYQDYTNEELKMDRETRKILRRDIPVSATCIRVPVMRAHSEVIWATCSNAITPEQVRNAFEQKEGIVVLDNPTQKEYPMPLYVAGKDDVYVGRIRQDLCDNNTITYWCVADQIRKGAALNAVQIGEWLINNRMI